MQNNEWKMSQIKYVCSVCDWTNFAIDVCLYIFLSLPHSQRVSPTDHRRVSKIKFAN